MDRDRPKPDRTGRQVPLHALLGRVVIAGNGRRIGRIEDLRAEQHDGRVEVTACVLGVGGLLERLGVALGSIVGRPRHALLARWDQLDLSDPLHPRLRCGADELARV